MNYNPINRLAYCFKEHTLGSPQALNREVPARLHSISNSIGIKCTGIFGIAIGAGTDVAVETADIILVKSNPLEPVKVIDLSRATYSKMIQNLFWATG